MTEHNPPDIHDTSDGEHWRSLTVDQLLAAVAEQVEPNRDGSLVDADYARSIIGSAIETVIEDTTDRADDMAHCGKADECRAQSVVLTWLAWNLDHEMLPEGLR